MIVARWAKVSSQERITEQPLEDALIQRKRRRALRTTSKESHGSTYQMYKPQAVVHPFRVTFADQPAQVAANFIRNVTIFQGYCANSVCKQLIVTAQTTSTSSVVTALSALIREQRTTPKLLPHLQCVHLKDVT